MVNRLGARLRQAREMLGLSQTDLAKDIGMAANHVNRLEAGQKSMPRFDTVARLAVRLGLSLDQLAADCGYRTQPESLAIDPSRALQLSTELKALEQAIVACSAAIVKTRVALEKNAGTRQTKRQH